MQGQSDQSAPPRKFISRAFGSEHKQISTKTEPIDVLRDLSKRKLTDKAFFEKLKPVLDPLLEQNTGVNLGMVYEVLNEKGISSFYLCKTISSGKVRYKLKNINQDEEKSFFQPFLEHIADSRFKSAIAENLKLLGFVINENFKSISKKTQEKVLSSLNTFLLPSSHYSELILRSSLNCIGNLFSYTTERFSDCTEMLLSNCYEILRSLATLSAVDGNVTRLILNLVRVLSFLLPEVHTFDSAKTDFVYHQLVRYLYIGTPLIAAQNNLSISTHLFESDPRTIDLKKSVQISTPVISSSSEISDTDEFKEKGRMNENLVKIRSFSCMGIQAIVKQYPKILSTNWTKLLPFNIYTKDHVSFINNANNLSILNPSDSQKTISKFSSSFRTLYSQPSLAWLLLFDESPKVRASVCKTLMVLLDGLKVDNILINVDGERLDRSKLDPYKSVMHQVYQCLKNLNLNLLAALTLECDQFVYNQVLKVFSIVIAHSSFEKVKQIVLKPLLTTLVRLLKEFKYHIITTNVLACLSSLASKNSKLLLDEYCFNEEFDLFTWAFDMMEVINQQKLVSPKSEEISLRAILLFECTQLIHKAPRHYLSHLLGPTKTDRMIALVTLNFEGDDKKVINTSFKILEEVVRSVNKKGYSFEQEEADFPEQERSPEVSKQERFMPESEQLEKLNSFLTCFLEDRLCRTRYVDSAQAVLNILYYLNEEDWQSNFRTIREQLIVKMPEIADIPANKPSSLRLFGILVSYDQFRRDKVFVQNLYQIIKSNFQETNPIIVVKNSWIIANLCASLNDQVPLSHEQIQQVFAYILEYAVNTKEKILSNGYRALGYFLRNIDGSSLSQLITTDEDSQSRLEKIREIYTYRIPDSSAKVCWNICVSLTNVLRSDRQEFQKALFSEELLARYVQLLESKSNFKTQIHCLEMLRMTLNKIGMTEELYKLITLLLQLEEKSSNYDFTEAKYIPVLKKLIMKLLFNLLNCADTKRFKQIIQELLYADSMRLLKLMGNTIYSYIRYENEFMLGVQASDLDEEKKDPSDQVPEIRPEVVGKDLDELEVKGEGAVKQIRIVKDRVKQKSYYEEFLAVERNISQVASKIIIFVDESEDCRLPFGLYDGFKQLADNNIAEAEVVQLSLHQPEAFF